MRRDKPNGQQESRSVPEQMWTLDVALAALSGLVLYLIVTRLRFDDPRWLFNGWTYAIAVPLIAFLLAMLLRAVASRYVQKSIQLGFLFSVFLHLLLLILAINVVIFSRYFPDAFAGVKPERSPIRKTVPEYLFQTPQETNATPDWSKPTETQTASRVIPREQRQLPPLEQTRPKLETPQPQPTRDVPLQKFLMRRQRVSSAQPQPANSPSRRARQQRSNERPSDSLQSPTAPTVPVQAETPSRSVEREMANVRRTESTSRSNTSSMVAAPSAAPSSTSTTRTEPASEARSRTMEMPRIGEVGMAQQRQQRTRASRMQPAGAAPSPQTVAVAQADDSASRMLSPTDTPMTQRGQTAGAQLLAGNNAASLLESDNVATTGAEFARNNVAAREGMPNVVGGTGERFPGRGQRIATGGGFSPVGTPSPSGTVGSSNGSQGDSGSETLSDRLAGGNFSSDTGARRGGGSAAPGPSDALSSGPTLDMLLEDGRAGLGEQISPVAGVVPSTDQPTVAALELSPNPRPRREVGGPITPAGSQIASVESFSRRVMRTKGGATPTPAGQVGPATEEAIERGLAYLASIQNANGSWSLQGHGEEVLLQSDSAATGLCLLAFQGAGYTHRQHQYADTVSRGLRFLLQHQKTSGDLFRPENQVSNRNVAFYSHGIASLALCEAYGMTQDPELKGPAQSAIQFIVASQHVSRGGWRYTAQVSSDTSVSGWMMMALKSGELSGLIVPQDTYQGIDKWLELARSPDRADRYRYNPYAPDTPTQRHGRLATPTMTSVGMLMRMYSGWRRERPEMQSAADYLLQFPPQMGTARSPQRDTYYWYYATQVMFHMGGEHWRSWNQYLNPLLLESQIRNGPQQGSWDPVRPVPDRWAPHAGRLYVTTMNLLNLEVFYRHLPIYEETADQP